MWKPRGKRNKIDGRGTDRCIFFEDHQLERESERQEKL